MTTWGELRTQIRRSVLKETTPQQFSNDSLLDAYKWAMATFCEHTALPTVSVITGLDPDEDEYDVPDDVYDDLEATGILTHIRSDEIVRNLSPLRNNNGSAPTDSSGFYVWGDKIIIKDTLQQDDELQIRYFAYYPTPVDDDTELLLPKWAEGAVSLLTGAYAMVAVASASARIDRWKEGTEKGTPEDNALRAQADWMVKQYNIQIERHRRQDRENMFRDT